MEKISIKIKRKLYPGRTDVIPPQLPVEYKPYTSQGVPAGQKCEDCFFYQNGFCDFWKAPVEKDYWCKTWRNTAPGRGEAISSPCVSGATVTLCLTEDFNDIGVYTPFDGMMLQRDVVTNFLYTGDGYSITVFNSSDFQFKKFLEFSDYVLNWGDGNPTANLSIGTPSATNTYAPNSTGYTITLEQINPWGTVYVSKHISVPYTMNYPSAGNMFGTIELKPPGFETPIGCSSIFQDYIFSGDSNPDVMDHFSSAQGNFGVSIPFYITGESESHLTILQNWGPNMYVVGVGVDLNGDGTGDGIIHYITDIATGYTINDIFYVDTSGGTTFSGYTYGLDSRSLDHICCNYSPISPCPCPNAVGAFIGWFGTWQSSPPPAALAVGDPNDYDEGMIVEFDGKCYWRTGQQPSSAGFDPMAGSGHWEMCATSLIAPALQRNSSTFNTTQTDNRHWSHLITDNYSPEDYLRQKRLEQTAAISEPKPQYQKQMGSGPNYCCSVQIDKYGYALTVDMQFNKRVMQGWSNDQYYCDCNYSNVPNNWYTGIGDNIGTNAPPTHVFRHQSTGWIGASNTSSSSCQPNGPVNANSPFGTACGGHPDNWGASYWGPSAAGYQQADDNELWQSDNCYDGYSSTGCYWNPWPICSKNSWTASSGKRHACEPYVYGCMDNGLQSTQNPPGVNDVMDSFIFGLAADNLGTVPANYGDNWPRNAGPANTVNYGIKPDHIFANSSFGGCVYTIQACLDTEASNYMRGAWDDSGNFIVGSLDLNLNVMTNQGNASWVTINPCNTAGSTGPSGLGDCCYYSAGCTYNVGTGLFESALPTPPNTAIFGDHLNTNIVQVGPYLGLGGASVAYADIYPPLASMMPPIPGGPLMTCPPSLAQPYNPPNAAPFSYIIDDGSCIIEIPGCTDPTHALYCPYATYEAGCPPPTAGCMDASALNYNPAANLPCDDPSYSPPCSVPSQYCCCEYPLFGCTDILATNYMWDCAGVDHSPLHPDVDDGCCEYAGVGTGCPDPLALNYGGPTVLGCGTPPNPNDTSCCTYPAYGCTDPLATNYDPVALIDDGTCIYPEMEVPVGTNPYNQHEIELCMSAITKEEVLINICQEVEIQSELFINRGKQSVFETSQRLGEIDTIGALEIYGYGFYQINQELTKSTKWH